MGLWESARCIMEHLEEGAKEGEKRDKDGPGRSKHRQMEKKGHNQGWSWVNKLLVFTFVWPSLAPGHHRLSHLIKHLIKTYL